MNLSSEVNEAIERAIGRHAQRGDQVGYVANLAVAADADGTPTVITAVALRLNSAFGGEHIVRAFFVDTPVPTFEQVERPIADLLTEMRVVRIEQMKQIVAQAEDAGPGKGALELPIP